MNRLTTVVKSTLIGFFVINLILSIVLYIESAIDGKAMPWEYLGFVSLYGIIVSIIFGYMDRPILEKRLLIGVAVTAVALLIIGIFIGNQVLLMQSLYVLFGIFIGRKFVLVIDKLLNKDKN
jgi:hypothetical protein